VNYSTLWIFGAPRIVWLIVKKETNWSASLRSISSSGSPKELRFSGFEIPRQGMPLPAKI